KPSCRRGVTRESLRFPTSSICGPRSPRAETAVNNVDAVGAVCVYDGRGVGVLICTGGHLGVGRNGSARSDCVVVVDVGARERGGSGGCCARLSSAPDAGPGSIPLGV